MERLFTHMYVFEFSKMDAKGSLDLTFQNDTKYIAIRNQNYN